MLVIVLCPNNTFLLFLHFLPLNIEKFEINVSQALLQKFKKTYIIKHIMRINNFPQFSSNLKQNSKATLYIYIY